MHSGTTHNIIPNSAFINGTVRTLTRQSQELIVKRLEEICKGQALVFNGKVKLDYEYGYPPTINHSKETVFAAKVAAQIVGSENVDANAEPIMASEDFSYMIKDDRKCYLRDFNSS